MLKKALYILIPLMISSCSGLLGGGGDGDDDNDDFKSEYDETKYEQIIADINADYKANVASLEGRCNIIPDVIKNTETSYGYSNCKTEDDLRKCPCKYSGSCNELKIGVTDSLIEFSDCVDGTLLKEGSSTPGCITTHLDSDDPENCRNKYSGVKTGSTNIRCELSEKDKPESCMIRTYEISFGKMGRCTDLKGKYWRVTEQLSTENTSYDEDDWQRYMRVYCLGYITATCDGVKESCTVGVTNLVNCEPRASGK